MSRRLPSRRSVTFINLPPAAAAASDPSSPSDDDASSLPVGGGRDPFLDPAHQVLLTAEEAKSNRKKEETMIELEKIQNRIDYTLTEFEGTSTKSDGELGEESSNVNFEVIEDPVKLYEMLSDTRTRARYQQHLTVFVVGFEEKCEKRERLLSSLEEFFSATQAGGTERLLAQVASEEVDFEEVTSGLESALSTAQNAAQRLLDIKQEMSKLIAIVAAYPDTKKGRKKLEKALLKAQEDFENANSVIEELHGELSQGKEWSNQLQKQVELKSIECSKLRKTTEQMKAIQAENSALKSELASVQSALKKANNELEQKSMMPSVSKMLATEVIKVDETKVRELEEEILKEKEACESLAQAKSELEAKLNADIDALKSDHEAEFLEMRNRYEEQLKSLALDDTFDGEDNEDIESSGTELIDDLSDIGHDTSNAYSEMSAEEIDKQTTEADGMEPGQTDVSAPTETADGSSDASQGKTTPTKESDKEQKKSDDSSGPKVDKLKREHKAREKKLKHDLEEVKAKSRKIITALRTQANDSKSKHAKEIKSLESQVDQLSAQVGAMENERVEFEEKVAAFEVANELLAKRLEESESLTEEQSSQLEELQSKLGAALPGQPENAAGVPSHWSAAVSGQLSPRSAGASPLQSATPTNIFAMEEVQDFGSLNSLQRDTPLFGTGAGVMYQSAISVEQALRSGSHSQLGSGMIPAHQAPPTLPLDGLSMLVQSRMSHHSSPQLQLGFDHPVLVEWVKAYECVLRFRDSLAGSLAEHPAFRPLTDDLLSLELHTLDRSQDVAGQVTQMRFSLALLLHQIEQTLEEGLAAEEEEEGVGKEGLATQNGDGGDLGEGGGLASSGEGLEGMSVVVAQLQQQLRQTSHTHQLQLQESKETIAELSSRVESLKVELHTLRQTLGSAPTTPQVGGAIMFTRLDSERNTRNLKTALERDRISPSTFHKVTAHMDDYLTIPAQRLGHMTRRCREKSVTSKLITDVHKSYSDEDQASEVLQMIANQEERRHFDFVNTMEKLAVKRFDLAHTLTHTLTHIEKRAGVFLIKPVFGDKKLTSQSMITPISRPLPVGKSPPPPPPPAQTAPTSRAGHAPNHRGEECGTPHPSMRLVSRLVRSRQTNHPEYPITGSANVSGRPSPRQQRKWGGASRDEWCIDASRPHPPSQPFSPTLPKMVELDLQKLRQPASLLGHILPGLIPQPITPSHSDVTPSQPHNVTTPPVSPPPHTLTPSQPPSSEVVHPITAHPSPRHLAQTLLSPLPPIRVPSRTSEEPITVP